MFGYNHDPVDVINSYFHFDSSNTIWHQTLCMLVSVEKESLTAWLYFQRKNTKYTLARLSLCLQPLLGNGLDQLVEQSLHNCTN